ncbi:hypothetical protein YC2023_086958 [Brassica napus]
MSKGKSFEDMEIKFIEDHQESTKEEIKKPLLEQDKDFPDVERTTWIQKAISPTIGALAFDSGISLMAESLSAASGCHNHSPWFELVSILPLI